MAVRRLDVPGPKAKAILERDRALVSPSYPRDEPFVASHGQGSELWDVDGNRYLDFASGIAVCSTGHSHPRVVAAIQRQAERFLHVSSDYFHERWVELAEALDRIAPFSEDAMSFLCNSGTEAVEAAVKLARHHTQRPRFLGFHGGFHGRTMGSLAFTSSKIKQREGFFPPMAGVTHLPFPDPYRPRFPFDSAKSDIGHAVLDYLEDVVFVHECPPSEVAAVLVEPIQGEGGYVVPPKSFFPRLREICDRHGILLIADEVQAGMGRTGKWWAIEHWGVEPDLVCVAKGIASGVPLGAMLAKRSVATWGPGAHGNTYGGNPLACAAALETIALVEEGLLDNARARGEQAMAKLSAMAERHPSIGEVRGRGLMIGVELVKDRTTKERAPELRDAVARAAFEHGLLLLGCGRNSIRLIPPLVVTAAELDEGLEILDACLTLAEDRHLATA
ncbi:MAG: aspartate aminotransferase family protein [Acidobacteriota bacterium]